MGWQLKKRLASCDSTARTTTRTGERRAPVDVGDERTPALTGRWQLASAEATGGPFGGGDFVQIRDRIDQLLLSLLSSLLIQKGGQTTITVAPRSL